MSTQEHHPAGLPPVDDAQLMAYVDGALPLDESRRVAEALARDAVLAARAERLRQAGQLARDALEAPDALAVPPALRAAVQAMVAAQAAGRAPEAGASSAATAAPAAPVTADRVAAAAAAPAASAAPPASLTTESTTARASPGSASAPRAPPRLAVAPRWWQRLRASFSALTVPMAVACSVFFGVVGFQLGRAPSGGEATTLALAVGQGVPPALAALLDRLPSGAQGEAAGMPVALVASFRDAGGALCRDFSVEAAQSPRFEAVACRRAPGEGGEGWALRYAAAAPTEAGGYAPASASAALDSYLASIGAHEPLDAQAEQAALAGLTKR